MLEFNWRKVSIPFKRESVSKVDAIVAAEELGFDVSIPFKRESVSKVDDTIAVVGEISVSIPFKRESVSKGGDSGVALI